jgi:hypothetical protein
MNVEELMDLVRESEVPGENLPHCHLSTINSPSPEMGLNGGHREGRLATNGLSYATAFFRVFTLTVFNKYRV